MKDKLSRLFTLCCIPVLLYFIYVAVTWGISDIYYRQAVMQLEKWSIGKLKLGDKDWDRLTLKLSTALKYDPNNPNIHEYLALALRGRFFDFPLGEGSAEPYLRQALAHYKQSISLRPVWPHAWVNLALVKYKLGETDQEFYHALHKADKLGPWEPKVQHIIIDISLHYWNSLGSEERKFTLDVIEKSLRHSEPHHSINTLKLIKHHGALKLICLIHDKKNYVRHFCRKNT